MHVSVGARVGAAVVGEAVGCSEGLCVGPAVGSSDGRCVGLCEGSSVGFSDGCAVGVVEGSSLGSSDGCSAQRNAIWYFYRLILTNTTEK